LVDGEEYGFIVRSFEEVTLNPGDGCKLGWIHIKEFVVAKLDVIGISW
jgi:hypothetical protein